MSEANPPPLTRRHLLSLIGTAAGSSAMYMATSSLGLAATSDYAGPIKLEGDAKGTSILILGAGLAGLVAALELRKAGYKVTVLEYNDKIGGRNWSLRGGDRYTELGGFTQECRFDKDLYLNPGPWRLPYHHNAILDYCSRLGVALEPFVQVNHNAYVHVSKGFGGKPQRYREMVSDFAGHTSELLAKVTGQNQLDEAVSKEDQEKLLAALKGWGALDKDYKYQAGTEASERRGWDKDPGGGLSAVPVPSTPVGLSDLLNTNIWQFVATGIQNNYEMQTPLFQPVGGMDMISRAFGREVGDLVRLNSKVTAIHQTESGVTITYQDTKTPGQPLQAKADWCLCTIPLSVLSQIDISVGTAMKAAIDAVPYASATKIGLQFKRRFWEQDDRIYGGMSYTDLPIQQIGYPQHGIFGKGKGVLLGAYVWGPYSFEFAALPPEERVRKAVEYGAQIHPQYPAEFENGVAVAWHRRPSNLGCFGVWTDEARTQHYQDLCQIDGRILLAGEHASYIPAWQEGAILSSLDAITRLHQRVLAGATSHSQRATP